MWTVQSRSTGFDCSHVDMTKAEPLAWIGETLTRTLGELAPHTPETEETR
ncbi:hypothetical protein BCF44_13128 [Kutzneria buriramensis]|uniref:Uncharacterized protein n=1 Tax=Kutzneria buriramensis TaxID=1045776 RepID=A0A3E0GTC6_9PSEU|nr:hypothetical protein BCF44_13128 [Kutzneria buriramensis]